MFNSSTIKLKLLRRFDNLELDGNKPVYKFHRYEIFRLKVEGERTNTKNGEIAFLAQDGNNLERCIINCTMLTPSAIDDIKFWRSVNMDAEICSYLVQDFVLNYLTGKYSLPTYIKIPTS